MSESGLTHDEIRENLAAYALGALPEAEAAVLGAHLEGCEGCRERLRWLAPAIDLLPASVEQRRPPDRLREELMETVRGEAGAVDAPRLTAWPKRRFGLPALRPAFALGAAAVLAAGVAVGYGISDGGGASPPTVAVNEVEGLGSNEIEGTLARQGDLATLRLDGMPKLRRDQVYEVWIDRDGKLEPSTLFVANAEREATAAISGDLAGADRVLVTAEPRGGSQTPTGAPLLKAAL